MSYAIFILVDLLHSAGNRIVKIYTKFEFVRIVGVVPPCDLVYPVKALYSSEIFVITYLNIMYLIYLMPIPVAVRSKAGVCGLSLTGIAGSNPAGGMDVCLL